MDYVDYRNGKKERGVLSFVLFFLPPAFELGMKKREKKAAFLTCH